MSINKIFEESWKNRLTKYEIARIISARALQLAMGASPLIDTNNLPFNDVISIAEEELKRGVLPITVRRVYPNGKIELVSVKKVEFK
ncbi:MULTISPECIES: DNA-directed RNA polymerase subunit K [Sulfurisphaera]|uniref:DNA-directed RNA polymerase subunit Rpo6 n=2 Tax=Sulfurisphaera TaxID=69655 RepID=RPO6_SULTO|nr:RecName: Full=DNA-directed RNA polymerase subunit Rpo6; AltName: Full=DNA-directed RNA polymerase subunit K [Sulfurisphaera tokodaii str. 7]MBB5252594.1 DNA-directed RNA polymerase subunit K [Sulfurisphaera ohwakuensis]BAB66258.1 DNA-directed RNA polymerase subunit K [Sulfurisphaera tokodaii str. 7]